MPGRSLAVSSRSGQSLVNSKTNLHFRNPGAKSLYGTSEEPLVYKTSPPAKTFDRAYSILEAAIACYARVGIENTTYETLAAQAKVSRPLLFKYFKDHDEIFYKATKLLRVHLQTHVADATNVHSDALERLKASIRATFDWVEEFPEYASGYLLALERASRSEKDRDLNSQSVSQSRYEISSMIRESAKAKSFEVRDLESTARRIHTLMTGAMLTLMTENVRDKAAFREESLALCLGLIKVKPMTRPLENSSAI